MRAELLHILQHSLGVNQYGIGTQYRNRFVTGPESDDFDNCRALVAMGLMVDHGSMVITGGMHLFTVTELGKSEMLRHSPTPPKLSRSKKRYLDFLRADSGMRFGDWLKTRFSKMQ